MEKHQTRILLVDDEPDIIEIIKFNLEKKDIKFILPLMELKQLKYPKK